VAIPKYTWGGKPKYTWGDWAPVVAKTAPQFGPGSPGYGDLFPTGRAPGGTTTLPKRQQGNPYADLINNMLNQQRSDIRGESVADAAQRDAAIRRVLISYGQAPDLAGFSGEAQGVLGGVLDQTTRDLISKNTAEGTSISARIQQAHDIAQRDIPANLATTGALHSGQTGYALGREALQNKQTNFDTLSEAIGNVESSVGGFAANERARQRQLAEYEMNAAMQSAQYWGDQDMGGGALTPPPGAPASAPSNAPLSQGAWLRLHPGGNYAMYLQAFRRHNSVDYGQQFLYGPGGYGG